MHPVPRPLPLPRPSPAAPLLGVAIEASRAFCARFFVPDDNWATEARRLHARLALPGIVVHADDASVRRLLDDVVALYLAFMRCHDVPEWQAGDWRTDVLARFMSDATCPYATFRAYVEDCSVEIAANTVILLLRRCACS